jgi:hypothetical protein
VPRIRRQTAVVAAQTLALIQYVSTIPVMAVVAQTFNLVTGARGTGINHIE